jgi:hypothetical protein
VHHWICGIADHAPATRHRPERAQLLANGAARAAGRAIDPLPVVRLFTPDAHVTWLLAALDPADGDTAYGLIDLGSGCRRWARSSCPTWLHRRAAQAARDARSVFPPTRRCRNTSGWPSATERSRTEYGHCDYFSLVRPGRSESAFLRRSGAV